MPEPLSIQGELSPSGPILCLIGVVSTPEESILLEELKEFNIRATLFVTPEVLVQSPRPFLESEHELGNGALVDATIDGTLPRWTRANLDEDLNASEELLTELGSDRPTSIFLPGYHHVDSNGAYRRHLQLRYPIAVSPSPSACSILGTRGNIHPIALGHTNLDDLAPLLTTKPQNHVFALIVPAEPALKKLRLTVFGLLNQRREAWHIAPLRDLLQPSRAYSIS